MRQLIPLLAVAVFCVSFFLSVRQRDLPEMEHETFEAVDNDWFMLQRVYPNDDLHPEKYERARSAIQERALAKAASSKSLFWQSIGPSNIGGRITSLALHPSNAGIIYAGAASGGVWKSTDNGTTWSNIFNGSASTGSLLLDPTNPEIVYVGTGEANPGGIAIYPGNGLWRSTDAGQTWTNLGLKMTGQLGRIAIDARVPGRIFVAALGLYRSRTQDRGVYRSTDNGSSWQRVLFLNDTTGACDVLIDPANPGRVLAALWNRYRPLSYSVISGPNSGIWASTNGGDSWTQITTGFPSNDVNLGRISLAASVSSPGIFYALAADGITSRGVFKSTDGGMSWKTVYSGALFNEAQVWYNNVIEVHPKNPDILFAGMVSLYASTDGGSSWSERASNTHVDQHAIAFDPMNPNRIVLGNDGGVFVSPDGGGSWTKSYNLPLTQFYAGSVDFTNPFRFYGGTQDNNTIRTMSGSENDWEAIFGGDGFYVLVDPTNPQRIYAEYQYGGLGYSTDGGVSFFDGRNGIASSDRTNWSTPFVMDHRHPLTLYVGTYRVYKTTNGMQSWSAISGDLTRGPGGRIGTISTIDVAQTDTGVIIAGTDDGKVSVTTDGGNTWNNVTGSLPVRWVTRVAVDPDSANVLYVTHSGYLEYEYPAHVHRSRDYGRTWAPIGVGLPDMPVNDIIVDPVVRPNLYIASDVGVLYSSNNGVSWDVMGNGLPEVPVHDLALHSPTRTLLAFTHGRSAYGIDLSGLSSVKPVTTNLPVTTALAQNYPNPFNATTNIQFSIINRQLIMVKVYDILGHEAATLVNEVKEPGTHTVHFDASSLSSGIYFYRLQAGEVVQMKKMLFLK